MRWLGLACGVVVCGTVAGGAYACDGPASDASRLAIAGGSITEIVYFLGEERRIVATDTTSNYPPEALDYPSVGYVRNLSTEGLLSLAPTLILGEDDMGPPAVLAQLAETGVEVVRLPEVHSIDGIVAKIRCVATVLGVGQRADDAIRRELGDTIETLSGIAAAAGKRPRVAVVLGLRDGVPLGAGRDTSGHGLIEMAAADNVFADFDGWKPLGMEAMVLADPEYIIVPERGVDDAGGAERLLAHPALALTAAARRGNLITMDGMSMLGFGPRTLRAAVELAGTLHGAADPERRATSP